MSLRPSPDMSAMKMVCVPSASTTLGPLLLVPAGPDQPRGVEAGVAAQRGVAGEQPVLGHQDVGQPVAGDVDELDVRVRPVEHRQRGEPLQRLEAAVLGPLEEAGIGAGQVDHVEAAAARQVEQPHPGQVGAGRQRGDGLQRPEAGPRRQRSRPAARSGCPALRFRL